MDEADLALHLARQAKLAVAKFTLAQLNQHRDAIDGDMATLAREPADAMLFDASTPAHLTEIGRLIEREAQRRNRLFVVGSSGVQYALTQWWSEAGLPTRSPARFDAFGGVDRVLACRSRPPWQPDLPNCPSAPDTWWTTPFGRRRGKTSWRAPPII
jgi:hypothetical protein